MERILILGPSASGKSTFANTLAQHLGLPVVHQDVAFFNDKNQPLPHQQATQAMVDLSGKAGWVVEGNYNQVLNAFLPHADTVIFLNFNRFTTLYRVLKRRLLERADPTSTPGGKHRVPLHFIRYILSVYPAVQKQQYQRLRQDFNGTFYTPTSFQEFIQLQRKLLKKS